MIGFPDTVTSTIVIFVLRNKEGVSGLLSKKPKDIAVTALNCLIGSVSISCSIALHGFALDCSPCQIPLADIIFESDLVITLNSKAAVEVLCQGALVKPREE